jgi:hypothetical protein
MIAKVVEESLSITHISHETLMHSLALEQMANWLPYPHTSDRMF